MEYTFAQLNDKEFEALVADLLSAHFDIRIERFKTGKDGGVDGRFFSDHNGEIILQCKHYLKTGYSGLISKLKGKEAEKVIKLSPEKYIFVTSLPLSRENKREIKEIFSPFIKREDDIFGQEDLNDILSSNPKIEEKYFKLWITSTNVFDRIINNAIKGRSQHELERIQENSFKYVQTKNHEEALKILEENHTVIISGEPGIGKTVLAENLGLFYASKDFEFIDIQESLSEAENVYKPELKQIFYFDDFLGSNYFEIIENKKDSHVVKFIDRIKRDKTKRFILTSRTNIFKSGVIHSPIFSNHKIEKQEYLIKITSLSELDRAKILYNHIWFSKLPEDYIDELYFDKRYRDIIRHKNFNPRLIQFITDMDRIPVDESKDYWEYIVRTLKNPIDVWDDCFKRQSNPFVRCLVNLTVFNGGSISEKELKKSYHELVEIKGLENPSHTEKDFRSMAELAIKSFLNRKNIFGKIEFSLFNPSIADYILREYSSNLGELRNTFKALHSVRSLTQIYSLQREKVISIYDAKELKQFLFDDPSFVSKNFDYQVYLASLVKDNQKNNGQIVQILERIATTGASIKELARFIDLFIELNDHLKFDDYSFIVEVSDLYFLDESDIKAYGRFIDFFEVEDQYVTDHFKGKTESYLKEELEELKNDVDLSKHIKYHSLDYHDYGHPETDDRGLKNEIHDMTVSLLNDFNSFAIDSLDLDISSIIDEIDTDQMFTKYFESQEPYNDEGFGRSWGSDSNDIDDLFERT
jgi:hypothetical protein